MLVLLALSMVSAALLGFQLLSGDAAYNFSEIIYVIVPVGAGLAIMESARALSGRRKVAWFTIGTGVLAWAVGEVIWVLYEFVLKVEVPYPGWADVFYVLGYPLVFAGVLLLPHVKPGRLERLRLTLDTVAGSIALTALMWVAYLGGQIYIDPAVGFLEQFINLMYPLADLFLLIAVMILAVRRTSRRFDVRLLALGVAMLTNVLADIIYVFQVEADTYSSGGWLDSIWLVGYGAFIWVAWLLLKPPKETEQIERRAKVWQLAAPYTAIVGLFALTLFEVGANASLLEIASGMVGVLIIARQGVAIRENRELVEQQRDDLISSISHELRTPITSLQGFAQLLSERGEELGSRERIEMAEIIERQSRHLGGIVTDLVDVARDRLSKTDLSLDAVTIDGVIEDARAMLPESTMLGVEVSVHAEPDLHVSGDRRRLTQVLVNLLINASRYGRGVVEIEAHAESGSVMIEIHDNGWGVPRRYQEVIWQRFERGQHHLDATTPGSGIGLAIVRSLIEAHDGSVGYRTSERLGGACFTVSLPRLTSMADRSVEPVSASGGMEHH